MYVWFCVRCHLFVFSGEVQNIKIHHTTTNTINKSSSTIDLTSLPDADDDISITTNKEIFSAQSCKLLHAKFHVSFSVNVKGFLNLIEKRNLLQAVYEVFPPDQIPEVLQKEVSIIQEVEEPYNDDDSDSSSSSDSDDDDDDVSSNNNHEEISDEVPTTIPLPTHDDDVLQQEFILKLQQDLEQWRTALEKDPDSLNFVENDLLSNPTPLRAEDIPAYISTKLPQEEADDIEEEEIVHEPIGKKSRSNYFISNSAKANTGRRRGSTNEDKEKYSSLEFQKQLLQKRVRAYEFAATHLTPNSDLLRTDEASSHLFNFLYNPQYDGPEYQQQKLTVESKMLAEEVGLNPKLLKAEIKKEETLQKTDPSKLKLLYQRKLRSYKHPRFTNSRLDDPVFQQALAEYRIAFKRARFHDKQKQLRLKRIKC